MSKAASTRLDAAESIAFSRDYEHVETAAYDVVYAELKGRTLVPVDNSMPEFDNVFTYRMIDKVGVAKWISAGGQDLPRVDVLGTEYSVSAKECGASFAYTFDEIKKSQALGRSLETSKGEAARWAIEAQLDGVIASGDATVGLKGLINLANTTSYTIPNGASGSQAWTSKTPTEILADLHGAANKSREITKGMIPGDTMIMPIEQFGLIETTRLGATSDTTILEHFLRTSKLIKRVEHWWKTDAAGSGSADRLVVYKNDKRIVRLILARDFTMDPPFQKNREMVTNCTAKTAGVVSQYPVSIVIADGI